MGLVLGGPPSAGILVATAQRGGTFRESFSIAKAYAEARKQHGESELLDEIAAAKPELDHTRYHSRGAGAGTHSKKIRDAVALWSRRARRKRSRNTGGSSSSWPSGSPRHTGRASWG